MRSSISTGTSAPPAALECDSRCGWVPRAASIAFAEYRLAGAALRLSPRGDLRIGQRDEGPTCRQVIVSRRPFVLSARPGLPGEAVSARGHPGYRTWCRGRRRESPVRLARGEARGPPPR